VTNIINFLVTKIDGNGNEVWSKSYGDSAVLETSDACVCLNDNNIIITGDKYIRPGVINGHLISLDSTGSLNWETTLESTLNGGCKNIMLDNNSDLVIIGEAATDSSTQFDVQMAKVNPIDGSLLWLKYLRASNESDAGFSVLQSSSNNYVYTGYGYDTTTFGKRVFLGVADSSGNELSRTYYSSTPINIGFDIQPSVYGGYLIAGTNYTSSKNILIYNSHPANIDVNEISEAVIFNLFPNPINVGDLLHWNTPLTSYSIYDVFGKLSVQKYFHSPSLKSDQLNLSGGLYLFRGNSNNRPFNKVLVVE